MTAVFRVPALNVYRIGMIPVLATSDLPNTDNAFLSVIGKMSPVWRAD
jgi:hypothetical protein